MTPRPKAPVRILIGSVLMGASLMTVFAQSVSLVRSGATIAFRAPDLDFIRGEPLDRLKDGHTVRVTLELDVLPRPGGAVAAREQRTYVLSYDLWEERFAVTLTDVPGRSVAYLTAAAAEDWCLEQLTVPIEALGRLGRDRPFWIRLGYRVLEAEAASGTAGGDFTLRGLIDALSRRRRQTPWTGSVDAGPFRLPQ